jgi:glutathione S-transferase
MLTLYYKPSHPFCRQVLAVIDRLGLQVDLKDATESSFEAELVSRGGESKVPYLVDEAEGVNMYESDAIVNHLQSTYGKKTVVATRPRIQISDNVCVSCEG